MKKATLRQLKIIWPDFSGQNLTIKFSTLIWQVPENRGVQFILRLDELTT
jgi:hypothetical protein